MTPQQAQLVPAEERRPSVSTEPTGEMSMFERLARDPNTSVEKIEGLMALWERGEARKAEQAFNAAMSEAQAEIRRVGPDARNSQTNSNYASYAAMDRLIRPIYTHHGFGLSFDTGEAPAADMVRVLCYVTHRAGHARTYRIDMPADGKGAKGGDVMTKTHATGSATTYGMRYLLKMIFNVAIGEDDDDGNRASGPTRPPASKAPEGFENWLLDFEATADNGLVALNAAWKAASAAHRDYMYRVHREKWDALKAKASKVKA